MAQVSRYTTREELAGALATDLVFFGRYFFPRDIFNTPTRYHYALSKMTGGEHEQNAIMAHRGWAKSTWLMFVFACQIIATTPKDIIHFILMVSESQPQTQNHLARITNAFRYNAKLRNFYGDLIPRGSVANRRFGATDVIFNNGVRAVALGTKQRVRGLIHLNKRPDYLLFDDIESETNAYNSVLRERNSAWFFGAALKARAEQSRTFVLQSPIAEDCIINSLMKDNTWNRLKVPVWFVNRKGERIPTWPEVFTLDRCDKERASFANQGQEHIWDREMLLICRSGAGNGIHEKDIHWFDGRLEVREFGIRVIKDFVETDRYGRPLNDQKKDIVVTTTLGCDPAISEKIKSKNCKTTFVAHGMDYAENSYILAAFEMRERNALTIANMALELCLQFHVDVFGIETITFQQAIADIMQASMRERGVHFTIEGFKPIEEKDARLQWPVARCKAGKVWIHYSLQHYAGEIMQWPEGKERDYLDGTYYSMRVAYPPSKASYDDLQVAARRAVSGMQFPLSLKVM